MRARTTSAGIAATLAAAILWGSSFSVNDIGLRHVGPGVFAFARFAIAAAVALAALAFLGKASPRLLRKPWFWGLCAANALAFVLQYAGQTITTPARTALLVNISPIAVALLERYLFGMRLGARRTIAVLLGTAGAATLILGGDVRNLASGTLAGDLLAVGAGLAWSVYFVYNDRAVEREDPIHLAAWTFAGTAAILALAPLLDPWLAPERPAGLNVTAGAAILYTALFTTALAFGLWAYGLTRIRASISATLLMVEILVASLVSFALGRETFGAAEFVGAAMLLGAVLLATSVAVADAPAGAPS